MRRRFDRWRRQDRIKEFEQGIAATPKERVHLMTEGSELFPFCGGVHTPRMGSRASLFVHVSFDDALLLVKMQA